jgi:hypothetical protein
VATTFEALLLAQVNFVLNPPRFRGSILSATAISVSTNIPYSTISEDSYGGWNSSNHYWVVPVAGLYHVTIQFKWSGTPSAAPSPDLVKTGTNALNGPNASATTASTGVSISGLVRCNVGDQLAAQTQAASSGFTTIADPSDNNFMEIFFVSL